MNEVTLASSDPSSVPSSTIPDLITSTTSGILGPIQSGASVYVGLELAQEPVQEIQPFFVGTAPDCPISTTKGMSDVFRFDALGPPSGNINTYRIIGTIDENDEPRIVLVNTVTNAPLGFILVGKEGEPKKKVLAELEKNSTPPKFRLQQSTYSPWPIIEGVALSFINYQLVPEDGGSLHYCISNGCNTPSDCDAANLLLPLQSIFFAPTTWFANCESGKDTVITSATTTLCSVFCAGQSIQTGPKGRGNCGKPSGGVCGGRPLLGFTNRTDCTNKFRYEYCTVPKQCVGTCRSACPSISQLCTFQSRSNGGGVYHCLGGSGPSGASGTHCTFDLECNPPQRCINRSCQTPLLPEKEEQILIIVAVVVGVMVLGVVLFVLFLFVKGLSIKKK